ncbi:MAG: EF-hand domain-containing protein [Planctomycetes bacterium]|nr:EF-hand domain-containing protein [Planctomycetota bacterium]
MQRIMIGLLTAVAVVVLPSYLAAEEGKRPDRPRPDVHRKGPNPEMMFKRLDANRDNVVTADELPADMPEQFKKMLIRADENKDGELTLGELRNAFKHRRDGHKAKGGPVMPPYGKNPKAGGAKSPKQTAKALFVRLDKDKDGKLSFEEFSVGLRHLRHIMAARADQWCKPMRQGFGPEFDKKYSAKGPKHHGHAKYAKGHKHHGHKYYAKGPKFHGGNKFAEGPWCVRCTWHGMGPWHPPHGMQFGMNPWHPPVKMQAWGQGHPDGKNFTMRQWRPDGKKKQWAKKPNAKKPAVRKPNVKVDAEERIIRIEARLTALEMQQEAILVAIQEQQATMMAALQRTNKLVSAKLASLGRQQERVRPQWDEARPERKSKELAKAEKEAKQRQKPRHNDRD